MGISEIQELRRSNLAALRRRLGAAKVADRTGLPLALLYQMALGKGKSRRNISDEHAKLIEAKCHLPPGWLDTDHEGGKSVISAASSDPSPDPLLSELVRLLDGLSPEQLEDIRGLVEDRVARLRARTGPRPRKSAVPNS